MSKRFVHQTIASFGLVLSCLLPVLALDQVEYHAIIEKEKIVMGEKVQYLVRVNYPTTTMKPAITPPSFSQFTVLSDHESVKDEGSGVNRYKIFRKVWLLEPNESGNLSIASAIVTFQDPTSNLLKNGKTDIIFINVNQRADTSQPPPLVEAQPTLTGSASASDEKLSIIWIILGGGGLLVIIILVIINLNRQGDHHLVEEQAEQALQKAIVYAEQGDLDGYNKLLSHALLDYLQQKFNIDAHVLSTDAIMEKLSKLGIDSAVLNGLDYYFKAADQAKFGGFNPDEDELIKLHGTVSQFIKVGQTIKIKKKKPHHNKSED